MKMKEAVEAVVAQLAPELAERGFKYTKSKQTFRRSDEEADLFIVIFLNKWPSSPRFYFGPQLSLSHRAIEAMAEETDPNRRTMGRYLPDLVGKTEPSSETPSFATPAEVASQRRAMLHEIVDLAIPYLERHSTLDQLRASYEGPIEGWPSFDHAQRCRNLLIIDVLRGARVDFERHRAECTELLRPIRNGFYAPAFAALAERLATKANWKD